jgi:hypothetical protein
VNLSLLPVGLKETLVCLNFQATGFQSCLKVSAFVVSEEITSIAIKLLSF